MYTVDRTWVENTAGMLGGRDTEGGRHTEIQREHRDAKRDTQREIRETETETYPERMNHTPEREWGLFIALREAACPCLMGCLCLIL